MKKMKRILPAVILILIMLLAGIYYRFYMLQESDREFYLQEISVFKDPNFIEDIKTCKTSEVYRFFWNRSFHDPVLITVLVKDDEQGMLYLKVLPKEGSLEPELHILNRDIFLNKEEVVKLRTFVYANRPWRIKNPWNWGFDGATWTIEIKNKNSYYWNSQWCPDEHKGIRKIGLYLVGLSGLKPDPNEIY